MAINFCPNREHMRKEVEQCSSRGRLDVLASICKCCVYQIFEESTLVSQCISCDIGQGIGKDWDVRSLGPVLCINFREVL